MSTLQLVRQLHARGAMGGEGDVENADALIGLFQGFRPRGDGIQGFFDDLEPEVPGQIGQALEQRLADLFAAAGDDRRPQGGRDAYFVVRRPEPLEPDRATELAGDWLTRVAALAAELGEDEDADRDGPSERGVLYQPPRIRVLEGLPPKHPKNDDEKTSLLKFFQQRLPRLLEKVDVGVAPAALRQAYYYVACDAVLRDYLMWPLYRQAVTTPDPHAAYFVLWKHGVKYRIFQDDQIDFYLPRY